MSHRPLAVRLAGVVLLLFPRRFRCRYGEEMLDFLTESWHGTAGWARAVVVTRWVKDVALHGLSERTGLGPKTNGRWTMGGWTADLRFALRGLRKRPGFAGAVIGTTALGIGAATAVFAVVDAAVLRPLPYPERDRLVALWTSFEGQGDFGMSLAEHYDYAAESRVLEALGSYQLSSATLTGLGEARRATVTWTWGDLFGVIGARVGQGRLPRAEDAVTGAAPVAVVSHTFWANALGGDPRAIGSTIDLDQVSVEIIGVLEPGVRLPDAAPEIWRPIARDRADIQDRSGHSLEGIGRLAAGQSLARLRGEIEATHVRWHEVWAGTHSPGHPGHTFASSLLHDRHFGALRSTGTAILGAILLVLLLACANVASLLLARGETRAGDLALRRALGAGRACLVRQLLVESVVMSSLGGALGLGVAVFGLDALLRLEPGSLPRVDTIGLDARVTVFAVASTVISGMVFGILPALRAGSTPPRGSRSAAGPDRSLGRSLSTLVVGQVGIAIVLLAGAGLLLRSVAAIAGAETGIETERRLAFDVSLPGALYSDLPSITEFWDRLDGLLEATPGVEDAALVRLLPLRDGLRREGMEVPGREVQVGDGGSVAFGLVSPGYFSVMGIPVVQGREFSTADVEDAPWVGLVNEAAARAYWPDSSPLGREVFPLFMPREAGAVTIVGVVGDVQAEGVRAEVTPELYLTHAQIPSNRGYLRTGTVVARTSVEPEALFADVRRIVDRLDPQLPVTGLSSLEAVAADARARERFVAMILGTFALLALTLAGLGTYGVVAYAVAQRGKEFGIRIALGAPRASILGSVLRSGVSLALLGAGIGVAGALTAGPLLEGLLFGVGARDLLAIAVGPILMACIVIAASVLPAMRASRSDPLTSLREEA